MTNPLVEDIYCGVCGTKIGTKPGRGAILGVRCLEANCRVTEQSNPLDERNAVIAGLMMDGVPAPQVAVAFGQSRQRAYQVLGDWKLGR